MECPNCLSVTPLVLKGDKHGGRRECAECGFSVHACFVLSFDGLTATIQWGMREINRLRTIVGEPLLVAPSAPPKPRRGHIGIALRPSSPAATSVPAQDSAEPR